MILPPAPTPLHVAVSEACRSDLALEHVMQVSLGHTVPERVWSCGADNAMLA